MKKTETRGPGNTETRRVSGKEVLRVPASPCLRVSVSPGPRVLPSSLILTSCSARKTRTRIFSGP